MATLGNADLALDELLPMSLTRGNLQEIEKAIKRAAAPPPRRHGHPLQRLQRAGCDPALRRQRPGGIYPKALQTGRAERETNGSPARRTHRAERQRRHGMKAQAESEVVRLPVSVSLPLASTAKGISVIIDRKES